MNPSQTILIRPAMCDDAASIARVHVDSWRTTYRGIVPDAHLASLSVTQREQYWHSVICDETRSEFVYVAEDIDGNIVGFSSGGPARNAPSPYTGELYAIYLLETYQRKGIGQRLVLATAARLIRMGHQAMMLWVLADNPARRFYESLEGQPITSQRITLGGMELEEVAYGWQDIGALVANLLEDERWQQQSSYEVQASHRILAVAEDELQLVILDIHDGPVQKLFAASSQIAALQTRMAQLPDAMLDYLSADIARVGSLIEGALSEIKRTLGTLRPPEFRHRSLEAVVQGLVRQQAALTGLHVELNVVGDLPPVSLPVKIALYRILQEALSNAYRHAGVGRLDVQLSAEDGWVALDVYDKGRGFEPPPLEGPAATELQEHIGLRGMRERAQLVGGYMRLASHVGQGTHIHVKVPSHV
jgi:signal transduction histidine kinase